MRHILYIHVRIHLTCGLGSPCFFNVNPTAGLCTAYLITTSVILCPDFQHKALEVLLACCTFFICRLRRDSKKGYVTDAGQSFPSKSKCRKGAEILELLQLACGESLAHDVHVFFSDTGAIILYLKLATRRSMHCDAIVRGSRCSSESTKYQQPLNKSSIRSWADVRAELLRQTCDYAMRVSCIITHACAVYLRCESACGTKTEPVIPRETKRARLPMPKEGRKDFRSFVTQVVFANNADPACFGVPEVCHFCRASRLSARRKKKEEEERKRTLALKRSATGRRSLTLPVLDRTHDDPRLIGYVTKIIPSRILPFCLSLLPPSLLPCRGVMR
ncbi:hypothetical protein DBV15_04337, partial [Temnothorax longispinosus]